MAIESGSAKISDASLTSFIFILFNPGAFLEFMSFRIVSISLGVIWEPQLEESVEMKLDIHNTRMISLYI